jgi:hypothetical protein
LAGYISTYNCICPLHRTWALALLIMSANGRCQGAIVPACEGTWPARTTTTSQRKGHRGGVCVCRDHVHKRVGEQDWQHQSEGKATGFDKAGLLPQCHTALHNTLPPPPPKHTRKQARCTCAHVHTHSLCSTGCAHIAMRWNNSTYARITTPRAQQSLTVYVAPTKEAC